MQDLPLRQNRAVPHAAEPLSEQDLDAFLDRLDADALRALVRRLVDRDPAAARIVAVRAASTSERGKAAEKALVATVSKALAASGFVDYRRSFEVARNADEVLDELEAHLDSGAADLARPALLRALTRLRKVSLSADDSAGVIGAACHRAADLHARSCRDGNPERVKLARWLVAFRDESPGWPETPLAAYVDAFDERALAAYREGVGQLDDATDPSDGWRRRQVDRMLLELADHDGDVDRAVELLSRGEHTQYAAIVERLRHHDRHDEAIDWIDRGVAAGRVSGRFGPPHDFWLDPLDVADTYLGLGRVDEAIEVMRRQFLAQPGHRTLTQLLAVARRAGREAGERAWAIAAVEELAARPTGPRGAPLVEIALAEGELDAAWSAAERFGAGAMWQELADASRDTRPRAAGDLHRADLERRLDRPDTRAYPVIARQLVTVRDLYQRAGDAAEFEEYLRELKATYSRRTALMAALAKKRL
jgi:hypothetical protein